MSKTCGLCEFSEKKSISPKEHNCCRNWSGSAKYMEPAMSCEMLQDVINQVQRVCSFHIRINLTHNMGNIFFIDNTIKYL